MGVILIFVGILQIAGGPFQRSRASYYECMTVYEEAKLNAIGSKYDDLRYLASDLASDMYSLAMGEKQKIITYIVKCVVLCTLGITCEGVAIYLKKKVY